MRCLALLLVFAAACGRMAESGELDGMVPPPFDAEPRIDGGDPEMPPPETPGCALVARTCAQVIESFPTDIAGLSVSCDDSAGTFTLQSTGVPNYESNQTTPNAIGDQMWLVTFPLQPACSDSKQDAVATRGPIGFMINGVPFYGPQDARGRDAVEFEGRTFDDCTGHADPRCSYHYHAEPVCIASRPEPDGHPSLIGYALDGFGVYEHDDDLAAHPLDVCHGHSDPRRGYHYHATATFPYLMACFMGRRTARVTSVPACMH